jgi:uncharacterized membrane protein
MIDVERSLLVHASAETVFELVSEPLRFPELLRGFTRVERASEQSRGEGARYLMLLKVGPIDAGGIVRVTEWHRPDLVAWTSERGVEQSGTVVLAPRRDGWTEATVHMHYAAPGTRWGALLVEQLSRHVIDRHVHAMLLAIKRHAEFERTTGPAAPASP